MSIIHFLTGNSADTADEGRFIFNREFFTQVKETSHLHWRGGGRKAWEIDIGHIRSLER